MEFRTVYTPRFDASNAISHASVVWMIGSCFSDNIGTLMSREGFDVEANPLGTLYNPASICHALDDIIDNHQYVPADLIANEGKYHSLMRHSRFSARTPEQTCANINGTTTRLHHALGNVSTLILTFGSSIAFVDNTCGQIVANCHKLPASRFNLTELSVDDIVSQVSRTIQRLRQFTAELRVIYTVSPIRHKGYGIVRDRLSKSRLLMAIDRLCNDDNKSVYFPAYDIMMDDLRDYRFYAPDMIHPSETAVQYIYEKFGQTFFDTKTQTLAAEQLSAWRRTAHITF